jgi:hypothetical protein
VAGLGWAWLGGARRGKARWGSAGKGKARIKMKNKITKKIKSVYILMKTFFTDLFMANKPTNGWLIAPFIDEEGRVL